MTRLTKRRSTLFVTATLAIALWAYQATGTDRGLVLSPSRIPASEIRSGGPGKDGIPALVSPRVLDASEAGYLRPADRVLGLALGAESRAYPIRILNWHEVVNDVLGGVPVLVTYCPLCASGLAFRREIAGETLEFGVSGRLYQSNVLMYDRTHLGLWSQLQMEAVTGPQAGTALEPLPLQATTWEAWRLAHPSTSVLSLDTGHTRDYGRDPYQGYDRVPTLMFPVRYMDARRDPKDLVVGILNGSVARAYPLDELARAPRPLQDILGGRTYTLDYDPHAKAVTVRNDRGLIEPAAVTFWFAWLTFHPTTEVFQASDPPSARHTPPRSTRDAPEILPLAVGKWWLYEERVASGDLVATERWKVRARHADAFVLTTRQHRIDGMHASGDGADDDDVVAVEEQLTIRSDGIVRRFADSTLAPPMYLLPTPVELDRSWADRGGHCQVTANDAVVRAADHTFESCVQVTCRQGETIRIVSSYAGGVGLVRQDLWYGGLGPIDGAGDASGLASSEQVAAASTLVLKAWGSHAPH
ncbi:MAG: DUF3179 domain-containing protein [Gemmatimonadaceae bacterium]|nr:DUF3179 domain-containing protein [Gemmatimonadaceae bacterium]